MGFLSNLDVNYVLGRVMPWLALCGVICLVGCVLTLGCWFVQDDQGLCDFMTCGRNLISYWTAT